MPFSPRSRAASRSTSGYERTIAWIGRNRRLSKDYEYHMATSEAWVYLSMVRVMLKRLAREQIDPEFHYRRVA
jgi:transposase